MSQNGNSVANTNPYNFEDSDRVFFEAMRQNAEQMQFEYSESRDDQHRQDQRSSSHRTNSLIVYEEEVTRRLDRVSRDLAAYEDAQHGEWVPEIPPASGVQTLPYRLANWSGAPTQPLPATNISPSVAISFPSVGEPLWPGTRSDWNPVFGGRLSPHLASTDFSQSGGLQAIDALANVPYDENETMSRLELTADGGPILEELIEELHRDALDDEMNNAPGEMTHERYVNSGHALSQRSMAPSLWHSPSLPTRHSGPALWLLPPTPSSTSYTQDNSDPTMPDASSMPGHRFAMLNESYLRPHAHITMPDTTSIMGYDHSTMPNTPSFMPYTHEHHSLTMAATPRYYVTTLDPPRGPVPAFREPLARDRDPTMSDWDPDFGETLVDLHAEEATILQSIYDPWLRRYESWSGWMTGGEGYGNVDFDSSFWTWQSRAG